MNSTGSEVRFENGDFNDFVLRPDTNGNHINAHHGGILFVNGKYWWYGQANQEKPESDPSKPAGATTREGVVMYSSPDLREWTYEGVILACEPSGALKGPMRFERPKIIYNAITKQFVMWYHHVTTPGRHGYEIGMGDAGVATCDTINGTYTFQGYQRPAGPDMRVADSTLFQDDDGKAYFIYDSLQEDRRDERCLHISELSEDYLTSVHVRKIPELIRREAPAMIKRDGFYFLLTSGLTGWDPNPARCHRATNIWGPYDDLGDPCSGENAEITYNSQSTYVFELQDKPGSLVFMGDRWNLNNMKLCAHIWLPLEFPTKDTLELKYHAVWETG